MRFAFEQSVDGAAIAGHLYS